MTKPQDAQIKANNEVQILKMWTMMTKLMTTFMSASSREAGQNGRDSAWMSWEGPIGQSKLEGHNQYMERKKQIQNQCG